MTKRTPEPDPFNNPFSRVKLTDPKKAEERRPAPPPPRKEKPVALDAEAAMFLEAMGEVIPTRADKKRAPPTQGARIDPVKVAQEESESLTQLAELVAGDGPFELTGSGPLLQGWVPRLDPKVIARLRTGGFRLDATLELGGLTQPKAQAGLEPFIVQARRDGHRCVKVNTGTALPRAHLGQWLTRGRLARHVLAFCSGPAVEDGGDAVYVLLRR